MENVSASPSASVALKEATLVAPSSTTKLPGSARTGARLGTAGADAPPPPPPPHETMPNIEAIAADRKIKLVGFAFISTALNFGAATITLTNGVVYERKLMFCAKLIHHTAQL